MSTSAGGKPPSKRASRARGPNKGQAKTKIVVRRLPANLPEFVFMESIKPHVPDQSVERPTTWIAGKVSKNPVKGNTFARAYIYFRNERLATDFQKAYHGHAFMDKHGNEGRAFVEYAPFQKVPRDQRKADTKQGTIEDDPDYQAFLLSLTAEPTEADKDMGLSGTELLLKESANNPKSTPLLEALRTQKAAAKQAAMRQSRQGRQGGKASLSNSSKAQITILANRNPKIAANNSNRSSGQNTAGSSSQQHQQQQNVKGQQSQIGQKQQQQQSGGQQGKKATQNVDTANAQPTKPKRERKRRERGSKKAEGEAAAAAAGNGPSGNSAPPQITLLKPPVSTAASPNTKPPSSNAPAIPTQIQARPSSSNQGRGQQKQSQQQSSQQQSVGAASGESTKPESGRSGRTRKSRSEKAKEPKPAAAHSNNVAQANGGANGGGTASSGKPAENGGAPSRSGRSRRNRGAGGGGGDNPSSSVAQG